MITKKYKSPKLPSNVNRERKQPSQWDVKESIGTANSKDARVVIVDEGLGRRGGRDHGIILCSAQNIRQVEPGILIGVARFEVSYVSNSLVAAQMLSSNTPGSMRTLCMDAEPQKALVGL